MQAWGQLVLPAMNDAELLQHLSLTMIPQVGDVQIGILLKHFGSAASVLSASAKALEEVPGIGTVRAASIRNCHVQQRVEAEWATEKSHRIKHKHNELHNAHEKQVVPVLTKLLRINELLREAKELAESYDEAIDCETCYNDTLTPDSRWLLRHQCLTLANSLCWTLNDCDNARNILRDTPIEFQFYPSGDSL